MSDIWIDLLADVIPASQVRDFVMGIPDLGGIVSFEGATRVEADGQHGRLVRLDYEAYESMARRQLERMAAEAMGRWRLGRIAVVHRLGPVPVTETSVMIAVAAPHRVESFEACRWLIDGLKSNVPIWKMDVFEDGFARWVEPASLRNTDLY